MKKELIFLICILFLNLILAGYDCSEGIINEDSDEIKLYECESINGLRLGLIFSDEIPAPGKYSAKLLTDGRKFALTNLENSTKIEMMSGTTRTITLLNITPEIVKLNVEGETEEMKEGETKIISGFNIHIAKVEGSYPGTANVEGIIGEDRMDLDGSDDNRIINLDGKEYSVTLSSASDTNAIIKVEKCSEEGATIIEITEPIEGIPVNSTQINDTSSENANSAANNTTNTTETHSIYAQNNQTNTNLNASQNNAKKMGFTSVVLIISILIAVIFIIVLFFKFSKSDEE